MRNALKSDGMSYDTEFEDVADHCSYEHYLSGSETEA